MGKCSEFKTLTGDTISLYSGELRRISLALSRCVSELIKASDPARMKKGCLEQVEVDELRSDESLSLAEELAASTLDEYWDREYPVDPHKIAERMGIEVYFGDGQIFRRDVSGVIVKLSNNDPVMYVNEEASAARVRFTIAHEIGHYVEYIHSKAEGRDGEFGYIDLVANRIPTATGQPDVRPEEVFADAFAHSLLMPVWQVKNFIGLGYNVKEVADYFGVSVTSMRNRLNALNIDL